MSCPLISALQQQQTVGPRLRCGLCAVAVLDQMGLEPSVPRLHEVIPRQVEHMARLLDDLLDVLRVTSGRVTMQRRRTAISEVVDQAVETSSVPPCSSTMLRTTVKPMPRPSWSSGGATHGLTQRGCRYSPISAGRPYRVSGLAIYSTNSPSVLASRRRARTHCRIRIRCAIRRRFTC